MILCLPPLLWCSNADTPAQVVSVSSGRLEGQRDNLYNQTFNLEQVSFAHSGLKDAQQTVS